MSTQRNHARTCKACGEKCEKRVMSEAFSAPKRKSRFTCRDCPKWKPCYCSVLCVTRIAMHPPCRYGLEAINSKQTAQRYHKRISRS